MTGFNPCVVIDLKAHAAQRANPRPTNCAALEILTEAQRLNDLITDAVEAGLCNAGEGRATARLGSIVDGHTLAFAAMLTLELVKLRQMATDPRPADIALQGALAEWLYQRGNGNA